MSKNIQIVTTNLILRHFRKIDIFEVKLGFSINNKNTKPGETPKITVKDNFVKKYENINSRFVHKYGQIGTIIFYEDNALNNNEMHIYKDEQVYEINIENEDFTKPAATYLTEILKMIDNNNPEVDSETNMIKNVLYTSVPDNITVPNEKLKGEEYINALVERRDMIDKLNKK